MITTCARKHHRGSGEVNKERIAVNTFLYAFPYWPGCIIFPLFLSMLHTVDKACPAKVISCQAPSWVTGWEADSRILQADTKAEDNF